ncbi:hypothetical protein LAD12857_09970 [Lacrimispora amygdalina]|uniref:Methyltransferase type 11 domain-containing protein n=1 Tax=Lacrimispora amygdalina TaxID=253257 RepID=A0ABQ5M367_9FIRM
MKEWSKYFQLPEFLEYTRKYMLTDELRELVISHMHLKEGDKILEAGCGTGYLGRYLKKGVPSLQITAFDRDKGFIEAAKRLGDGINFFIADAKKIPFDDSSFDHVVSHTFFTSVNDPKAVLKEMKRVLKPEGIISSITSMSFIPAVMESGHYPPDCKWLVRYRELYRNVWNMYEKIDPVKGYTNGMTTAEIPHFFAENGLKDISLYPIGSLFSFSNASLNKKDREKYVIDSYECEWHKLNRFLKLDDRNQFLKKEEAEEYLYLLEEKKNFLLDNLEDNSIFEWTGSGSVLITGRK